MFFTQFFIKQMGQEEDREYEVETSRMERGVR